MAKQKMKVLMATPELNPIAKIGGLADVAASLSIAMLKQGIDARVVLPLYGSIDRKKYGLKKIYSDLEVPSGMRMEKVNIWEGPLPGSKVKVYYVDSAKYFGKNGIYLDKGNSERYLFFSVALLYMLPVIDFIPDVLHCHDAHTALAADIIKTSNLQFVKHIKTVFTIHNFFYQGKTGKDILSTGNLSIDSLKSLSVDARDGDINFMVQGVLNADVITTVSKTYAKEIGVSAYGAGLERIIAKRKNDLYGIVNGIDVDLFDPRKDKYIVKRYSVKSTKQKIRNKLYLQNKLGLSQDKNKAVVALVSRLVWQKGIDLIDDSFGELDCQFVFLGTGNKQYEDHLKRFGKKFPDKVSANITFNMDLAQQIYAGSDIFLMPSRFEPCGLGQMIAMRYGTVPVVRQTGGLKDTVNSKVGFSFKEANAKGLHKALAKALRVYYDNKDKWNELVINGMNKDFTWGRSAKEYHNLYKKILKVKN